MMVRKWQWYFRSGTLYGFTNGFGNISGYIVPQLKNCIVQVPFTSMYFFINQAIITNNLYRKLYNVTTNFLLGWKECSSMALVVLLDCWDQLHLCHPVHGLRLINGSYKYIHTVFRFLPAKRKLIHCHRCLPVLKIPLF